MVIPTKEVLPFRQIHLDFHTSECIPDIGVHFDKKQFQEMLKRGHVNSINLSAKSLDGWAYFDAKKNERHPGLDFNLLDAEIDAANEIGVLTNLYVSCGMDEKVAHRHPEWVIRGYDVYTKGKTYFDDDGYNTLCLNTPYFDYLMPQIEEIITRYGKKCHGLWLDIVSVRECYCPTCIKKAYECGINVENKTEMRVMWEETYKHYTDAVAALVEKLHPTCLVFHNGGHIPCGRRDLIHMNTHLDIESLPTGGYGYQHLPLSARYIQQLGMEYASMTGRFHTTWGEFGGYKHPNALRYETALALANGAKISIGDHLHPDGHFDEAVYSLIGVAYSEVESKEGWCSHVTNVADVAMLSTEAVDMTGELTGNSNSGSIKMLLEGKYLYDVVDTESDFSAYKVVILPDIITPSRALTEKLRVYTAAGGKVIASGASCIDENGSFVLDLGAVYEGISEYSPTYFRPAYKPEPFEEASFVMYDKAYIVKPSEGAAVLGYMQNSYFNRGPYHFFTPPKLENVSAGVTIGKDGAYIAWDLFELYNTRGEFIYKLMFEKVLDMLLGEGKTITTNLPSQGIITLQDQKSKNRLVNHLIYAIPIKKGVEEVIEDIMPVYDINVILKTVKSVKKVYLAPQMTELPFTVEDNKVSYTVPKVDCHQMVVLDY